jgi:hypothetical protein
MNAVQLRGGAPFVARDVVDATGRLYGLPFQTFWLKVRNKGANPARLYFTLADFTADTLYVEIPVAAAATPYGEWEGPVELIQHQTQTTPSSPVEVQLGVWLRSAAGTTIELVAFQRRG